MIIFLNTKSSCQKGVHFGGPSFSFQKKEKEIKLSIVQQSITIDCWLAILNCLNVLLFFKIFTDGYAILYIKESA